MASGSGDEGGGGAAAASIIDLCDSSDDEAVEQPQKQRPGRLNNQPGAAAAAAAAAEPAPAPAPPAEDDECGGPYSTACGRQPDADLTGADLQHLVGLVVSNLPPVPRGAHIHLRLLLTTGCLAGLAVQCRVATTGQVLGRGHVNKDGSITCICEQCSGGGGRGRFAASKWEAHCGSRMHHPAQRIFLEDCGCSLKQLLDQVNSRLQEQAAAPAATQESGKPAGAPPVLPSVQQQHEPPPLKPQRQQQVEAGRGRHKRKQQAPRREASPEPDASERPSAKWQKVAGGQQEPLVPREPQPQPPSLQPTLQAVQQQQPAERQHQPAKQPTQQPSPPQQQPAQQQQRRQRVMQPLQQPSARPAVGSGETALKAFIRRFLQAGRKPTAVNGAHRSVPSGGVPTPSRRQQPPAQQHEVATQTPPELQAAAVGSLGAQLSASRPAAEPPQQQQLPPLPQQQQQQPAQQQMPPLAPASQDRLEGPVLRLLQQRFVPVVQQQAFMERFRGLLPPARQLIWARLSAAASDVELQSFVAMALGAA